MARGGSGAVRGGEPIAVDERLVMPSSGIEILEGRVLKVAGADPPHATEHMRLAYVLAAHVAPGFRGAVDMLTRTSADSDFAPDASVYPEGPDTETGGRRLEVLAFEVVASQRLSVPTKKARELAARGVTRIFALVLTRRRALEWDHQAGQFRPMHLDEHIAHPCLAVPIPIRALLEAAGADEAVHAALEARRPDLGEPARAAAEARGEARGRAETLLRACATLGVVVPDEDRQALPAATAETLNAVLDAVLQTRRWPGMGPPSGNS